MFINVRSHVFFSPARATAGLDGLRIILLPSRFDVAAGICAEPAGPDISGRRVACGSCEACIRPCLPGPCSQYAFACAAATAFCTLRSQVLAATGWDLVPARCAEPWRNSCLSIVGKSGLTDRNSAMTVPSSRGANVVDE